MYVYYVYHGMSKCLKQQSTCLNRLETSDVLIVFMVSSRTSRRYCYCFLTEAQRVSGTRKAISWSVTVYYTNISCHCSLTDQMEPVEDNIRYLRFTYSPVIKG